MEKILKINSSEEMINLGEKIGKNLVPNTVIAMCGDLGAGKTTFTKGIARALHVNKIVNSPTFVIMKIYEGDMTLYHLDVYRTNDDEFELAEYFECDGVCVVEWAENITSLLPKNTVYMEIKDTGNDTRSVTIKTRKEEDFILEGIE